MSILYLRIVLALVVSGIASGSWNYFMTGDSLPLQQTQNGQSRKAAYLDGMLPSTAPVPWNFEKIGSIVKGPITRIEQIPGSDQYLALDKHGKVFLLSADLSNPSPVRLINILRQLEWQGDGGLLGLAFHPDFNNQESAHYREVFLFYTYKHGDSLPIYNRLSRFRFSDDLSEIDASSEEIVFQQIDQEINHQGGHIFFGPDGFLYVPIGDEGNFFGLLSTQRLDDRLFSGILRIDVDFDNSRSHAIRRSPLPTEKPDDYPGNINNYMIPNDNPWLDPDGGILEEFYAIGLRSPYSVFYDSLTEDIWVADVGSVYREEITIVKKGSNGQWPYREGGQLHPDFRFNRPEEPIGEEVAPVFDYGRDLGQAAIGGFIYRGDLYPELDGKYIFGDWVSGNVWSISPEEEYLPNIIYRGLNEVTDFFLFNDGTIGAVDLDGNIFALRKNAEIEPIPRYLSELNAFSDLQDLTPAEGVVPYDVNSELWSDGALKKRWISLPEGATIGYQEEGAWEFPKGTVFIKHFELQISEDSIKKTETRFFVIDEQNQGYGITYQWDETDTDAELIGLSEAVSDTFLVQEALNRRDQVWNYPTRGECLRCHNEDAGKILGVKTSQLNREISIDGGNTTMNQLEWWDDLGYFDALILDENSPRLVDISDTNAPLEVRVRSYLDANCAHCHNGSMAFTEFDARFETPLIEQGLINDPAISPNSVPGNFLIRPQSLDESEIWVRDSSLSVNQMPPLARNILDEAYLEVLKAWIHEMSVHPLYETEAVEDLVVFPNPVTNGSFVLQSPEQIQRVRLLDLQGRIIPIYYRVGRIPSNFEVYITDETINPGLYVVQYRIIDGAEKRVKIVIQ